MGFGRVCGAFVPCRPGPALGLVSLPPLSYSSFFYTLLTGQNGLGVFTMFVYILHFNTPTGHAHHYVGSTSNVRRRLECHAGGFGARLTLESRLRGRPWELGALYQAKSPVAARKLERELKNRKNTPCFCPMCDCFNHRLKIKGLQSYPLVNLPFPVTSWQTDPSYPSSIDIREDREDESLTYVAEAMRTHKESLGFIPLSGIRQGMNNDKLILAEVDSETAGYLLYTRKHDRSEIKVAQLFTQEDFRNLGIGKALIRFLAAKHPSATIRANVRADLSENGFWQAAGFNLTRTFKHETSKKEINTYHLIPQLERV